MNIAQLSRRLAGVAAAAFALATAGAFLPHSNWWWGMNALHFYPLPVRLLWTIGGFAALGLTWSWAGRPARTGPDAAAATPRAGFPPLAWAGMAALAAGLVFHLARARQFLAGDGYALMERLARHLPLASRSLSYDLLEPATVAFVQRLRGPALNLTRGGFFNTLLGALLVGGLVLLLVLRARRGRKASSVALAALLLTQPALQLFCGDITPHGVLAAALVALFLLLLDRADQPARASGAGWPAAAALLALVELAGLLARPEGATVRAPLALSAWTNALNLLWLMGAPALVLLVTVATLPGGWRALFGPAARLPLAITLLFGAARLALITPPGAVREWEMFAAAGVALTGWAGAALAGLGLDEADLQEPRRAGVAPLATLLVSVGLFFTVPWIGLQVDAARGVDRHLSVADGSPRLPAPVLVRYHQAMGDRFTWLGQTFLAAQAYRQAFRVQPSFEDAWRSGTAYMACGRVEDAGGAFQECLRRQPGNWRVLTELGNALTGLNQYARADSVLRKAIVLKPEAAAARIHLARSLAMEGREGEARAMLETARPLLEPTGALRKDFSKLDENLPK